MHANETHRQAVLVARLDNLGKGASGAAVQNLRLMLGLPRRRAAAGDGWMPEPLAGPGPIYTLDGVTPKVAPDAFIAPTAAVIGDVEIGVGDRHLVPLPGARRHSTSSASARAPTSRTARSSMSNSAAWPPSSATM